MTRISWSGTFDAAHFIPGHPKCGRLHGHTFRCEIELTGELPENRPHYLVDFAVIKDLVMALDHRLIVPVKCEPVTVTALGEWRTVSWCDGKLDLRCNAVAELPITESSSERLAEYLARAALALAPNIMRVRVRLAETGSTWAEYEAAR